MHHETSSAQDSIISLEENLTSEKHYRADLEQELLKQKQVTIHYICLWPCCPDTHCAQFSNCILYLVTFF